MKKIIILSACASLFLFSCMKDKTADTNNTNTTVISAASIIKNNFIKDDFNPDFTFLISTMHPVALLEQDLISHTEVAVQAFTKDKAQVGSLLVNNINIPFESGTYFSQVASPIAIWDFVGKNVTMNLSGSAVFPSTEIETYSPNVANITFDGLVSGNKISFDSGASINWDVDELHHSNSIIVIEGLDANSVTKSTKTIIVSESVGKYSITNSDLADFKTCNSIKVYFARGIDEAKTIKDQKIQFTVMNVCFARLFKA
jgi:hypothetical protein